MIFTSPTFSGLKRQYPEEDRMLIHLANWYNNAVKVKRVSSCNLLTVPNRYESAVSNLLNEMILE